MRMEDLRFQVVFYHLCFRMINFFDLTYLRRGSIRQQAAFAVLTRYDITGKLAAFDPVLAGTIPIGIDVETSDLDLICCWADKNAFADTLQRCFGEYRGFLLTEMAVRGEDAVVASFEVDGFEVEIFGQNIPVRQQNAYRHMLIEHRILTEKGEAFRQQIIQLKQQGYKTEPAFARLLGLDTDDPYNALLALEF